MTMPFSPRVRMFLVVIMLACAAVGAGLIVLGRRQSASDASPGKPSLPAAPLKRPATARPAVKTPGVKPPAPSPNATGTVVQVEPPTAATSPNPAALKSPDTTLTPDCDVVPGKVDTVVFVVDVPPKAFTARRTGGA